MGPGRTDANARADGYRVNYGATNYLSLHSTAAVAVGSHYDGRPVRPPEGAVIRTKGNERMKPRRGNLDGRIMSQRERLELKSSPKQILEMKIPCHMYICFMLDSAPPGFPTK